jgi:hypothetical protein
MSKQQLIETGHFRLNLSNDDITLKIVLHESLGEDFRKVIDEAFLFADKLAIEKLSQLAVENIKYANL